MHSHIQRYQWVSPYLPRHAQHALAASILLLGVVCVPSTSAACSLMPPFTMTFAAPRLIRFVGHATSDTTGAGAGRVQFSADPGHFGPQVQRSVYGQVVQVEQLAPSSSADIRSAVQASGGRVVLVPWDYGPDCHPVPWPRSARWLSASDSGLFSAALRDRAFWASGVPTLDVFAPQFALYNPAAVLRNLLRPWRDSTPGPTLSPTEALTLYDALPTYDALVQRRDTALEPLHAWAQAHPALATRFPARDLLAYLTGELESIRFRHRDVALAGTYRITITLSSGDSSVFYARTERHPNSRIGATGGMYVLACAASSEAGLPAKLCTPFKRDTIEEGYFVFSDSIRINGSGRLTVPGAIDLRGPRPPTPSDSLLRRQLKMADSVISEIRPAKLMPDTYTPGVFTVLPNGRVTYEFRVDHNGKLVRRISAERISKTALDER